MNVNLLIDNIVRQTTVLVAQLATAAGGRAPLAHVAGQVFVELVRELKAQGLGNKVIADMFGLTLRTYHDRVRRASFSLARVPSFPPPRTPLRMSSFFSSPLASVSLQA